MKTFSILFAILAMSASAEAKLMKCTMTSAYNASAPQVTTGIIDTNDKNARIELNARNASVQPYAMVTASEGEALVNIVSTVSTTMSITGSNEGKVNTISATDAAGVHHSVDCIEIY